MYYILDGYNVIGASQDICLSQSDKEDYLIKHLRNFAKHNKHKITVVFDGNHPDFNWQSQYTDQRIKVVFTDKEETADAYIIRKIHNKQNKQGLIVVSSDREIITAAKRAQIKTLSSTIFWKTALQNEPGTTTMKPSHELSEYEMNAWLDIFGTK